MSNPIDKPCPNPYRNGQHETYLLKGVVICKACGAGQEVNPPVDMATVLHVTALFYQKITKFLIDSGRSFNTVQGERTARERLEDVLFRSNAQAILDEFDSECLRYSPSNGGMMLSPEEYKKERKAMSPPDNLPNNDEASENSLYSRLRMLAVANGGGGWCSVAAKSEKFCGVNFNREGALNFAKTVSDLGFDSVTIELGPNSALVSWK